MKRGSVKESLLRNASAMPDSIAIASSAYEPLSYAGLATEIEAFGAIFRSAGLGHMSRVAIAIGEAPKAALAITCVSCQATAVPLDPNLTPVELEQRLKLLRVDAAILLAGENCPLRRVAEKLDILVIEAISPSGNRLGLQLTPAQRETNATIPSVALPQRHRRSSFNRLEPRPNRS